MGRRMSACGDTHPEQDVKCRAEGIHEYHYGGYGFGEMVTWFNEQYVKPLSRNPTESLKQMLEIKGRVRD
jgi:hypothetical protein